MGLLQSLGLPTRAAHPAGLVVTKQKNRAAAPSITELAKWPQKAHMAWKRLDLVGHFAVMAQMTAIYGEEFVKDFAAAAKSGKTKLEGHDFVTALDRQTQAAMKAAKYKLAQYGSDGDLAQEWWVRADGFQVFLLRKLKPGAAPVKTIEPPVCSKESLEQIAMALGWARDAIAETPQALADIEAEKARMLRMNVTTPEFKLAYDAMTARLADQIAALESASTDVATAKDSLADSHCDLTKLDTAIDDLAQEAIPFQVEQGLREMDIRKPMNVDIKSLPDGDDDE